MRFWTSLQCALTGIGLAGLGAGLNVLAVHANGGRMPVFTPLCSGWDGLVLDARHACGSNFVRWAGITDWIQVRGIIYSPGDVWIALGQVFAFGAFALLIFQIVVEMIRTRK